MRFVASVVESDGSREKNDCVSKIKKVKVVPRYRREPNDILIKTQVDIFALLAMCSTNEKTIKFDSAVTLSMSVDVN